MSIPIDSAFSGPNPLQESEPGNEERQPNADGTFNHPESFCAELAPQATRYAMSIVRVWADAEEIVQEAYCRLLQSKGDSQEPNKSLNKALLFTTVRNLAIDQLRKRKRRTFEPLSVGEIASTDQHSNESRLQHLELAVEAIMKDLPSQWSDALKLKINGSLSYNEISEVLNATHAQVRTWIYRARKQLETDLNHRGLLALDQQGLLNRRDA